MSWCITDQQDHPPQMYTYKELSSHVRLSQAWAAQNPAGVSHMMQPCIVSLFADLPASQLHGRHSSAFLCWPTCLGAASVYDDPSCLTGRSWLTPHPRIPGSMSLSRLDTNPPHAPLSNHHFCQAAHSQSRQVCSYMPQGLGQSLVVLTPCSSSRSGSLTLSSSPAGAQHRQPSATGPANLPPATH